VKQYKKAHFFKKKSQMFMQFGMWCFLYFWVRMCHFKLILSEMMLWIFLFL